MSHVPCKVSSLKINKGVSMDFKVDDAATG